VDVVVGSSLEDVVLETIELADAEIDTVVVVTGSGVRMREIAVLETSTDDIVVRVVKVRFGRDEENDSVLVELICLVVVTVAIEIDDVVVIEVSVVEVSEGSNVDAKVMVMVCTVCRASLSFLLSTTASGFAGMKMPRTIKAMKMVRAKLAAMSGQKLRLFGLGRSGSFRICEIGDEDIFYTLPDVVR
jgi:hypothetical protein